VGKENTFSKSFLLIFYMFFSLGLLLSFWYAHHQVVRGDQLQMLQKGYTGAYTGYWISYGNSSSAMGNVPGTLSSLVVGLPLLVADTPWAPMVFLILLHSASFFLFDNVIKNTFQNDRLRLIFLVLYWLNPWFLYENKLYNVSYLFFCSALHIWSAYKMKREKSFWYTFLHLLAIGSAIQLHHSGVLLVMISLCLIYKKLIHVNWVGILFACFTLLISLIPYFRELLENEAIRHNAGIKSADRYIGWGGLHAYPVFKAVLYWFRYGSFFFTKHIVSKANFGWMNLSETFQNHMDYFYKAITFSIGAFTLWISWISNKFAFIKIKNLVVKKIYAEISDEEWIILYAGSAFIGVFVSAVLSPIVFVHWHLMIVFPFALFPFLVLANAYHSKYFTKLFVPVIFYFIMVNLMTSISSGRFDINSSYEQQTRDFIKTNQVLKKIENKEEFIKHHIILDPW